MATKRDKMALPGKGENEQSLVQFLIAQMDGLHRKLDALQQDVETKETRKNTKTLSEVYLEYLETLQYKKSTRGFANKFRTYQIIEADMGSTLLGDLNVRVLEQYINSWTLKTYNQHGKICYYSQTSIDKAYNDLRAVIRYCAREGYVPKNYMADVQKPISRVIPPDEYKALTDAELHDIVDAFENDSKMKLQVLLLFNCGLRPGELYALQFSDFDYEAKKVSIRRALSIDLHVDLKQNKRGSNAPFLKALKTERDGHANDGARRELSLTDQVIDLVKEYEQETRANEAGTQKRRAYDTQDLLFTKRDGNMHTPQSASKQYRAAMERVGFQDKGYTAYRFRHTYCTRLCRARLDPKLIARLMGDRDITMIMRVYNSINQNDIEKASEEYANQISDFLEAGTNGPSFLCQKGGKA